MSECTSKRGTGLGCAVCSRVDSAPGTRLQATSICCIPSILSLPASIATVLPTDRTSLALLPSASLLCHHPLLLLIPSPPPPSSSSSSAASTASASSSRPPCCGSATRSRYNFPNDYYSRVPTIGATSSAQVPRESRNSGSSGIPVERVKNSLSETCHVESANSPPPSPRNATKDL